MTKHWLINDDSRKSLNKFKDNSIHLVVTSPPYFNAREYSQWETLDEYLKDMRIIFEQVFRILDNHRIFVLNVGDVQCRLGKQPWTIRRVPLEALFTVMCQEIGFEFHKMPEGTVMTIEFELNGNGFTALNGGPVFKFNESISFVINCSSQQDVDYYWNKLLEGGEKQMCGWLKDKYGISWQIVPTCLLNMLNDSDKIKAQRVSNAMFKMDKIIIKDLEQAYNQA